MFSAAPPMEWRVGPAIGAFAANLRLVIEALNVCLARIFNAGNRLSPPAQFHTASTAALNIEL